MKISKCSSCKARAKIVWSDYLSEFAFKHDMAFIELCYTCWSKHFPESPLTSEVFTALNKCSNCNNLFLPTESWQRQCFECWKAKQKQKVWIKQGQQKLNFEVTNGNSS